MITYSSKEEPQLVCVRVFVLKRVKSENLLLDTEKQKLHLVPELKV